MVVFSNGTEYDYFMEHNCFQCKKCDTDSTDGCQMEVKIGLGDDEIPYHELIEFFGSTRVDCDSKCIKKELEG